MPRSTRGRRPPDPFWGRGGGPPRAKAGRIITDGGDPSPTGHARNWPADARAPLIECEAVGFSYPGSAPDAAPALCDIDLRVRPGEFIAVLGGNGSGKSTLARLLDGLLQPTTGRVRVAGMDTADPALLPEIRRRVGLVFQNPDNQIVASVVADDVAFGPENLGLPRAVIGLRVAEALSAVGMSEYAGVDPHHLSGGQKQRIAIAGALAVHPDCLCLDEPTSLLDPAGRAEVRQALGRLRASGCALVVITHYAEEAVEADQVIVLHEGRVATEGSPRAVFGAPEKLWAWGVQPPPAALAWAALRRKGLATPAAMPLTLSELAERLAPAMRPGAGEAAAGVLAPAPGAGPPAPEPTPVDATDASAALAPASVVPWDAVQLEGVCYRFPDPSRLGRTRRRALDELDLQLRPGECVALLGATGSGKSTAALHCSALLQPDAGTVSIDGVRPWKGRKGSAHALALRTCRRRVGLVFQYPEDQFFEERVLDEVAFAPRNHGAPPAEAEEAARHAMARVGLPASYANRSPLHLSGGEMRRVAIASLLAARPRYLLLDEPTAGLDAFGRRELAALLADLRASGIGILLITHRMEEAAALADRIAVIRDGRIVAEGTPREIFALGAQLASWDLAPPVATEWLLCLRRCGVDVPIDALTLTEAVEIVAARLERFPQADGGGGAPVSERDGGSVPSG